MIQYPIQITPCPIQQAIFEVRFTSHLPPEAVFGVIYQAISKHFNNSTLIQLPILQLPEAVRQSDPNLVYQPLYRLEKETLSISIGPKVITFSNQTPYSGWYEWKHHILTILEALVESGVCVTVERSGLRYINVFQEQLFDITSTKINVIDTVLISQSTTLRTEIKNELTTTILQLSNNVNIALNNESFIGSVIDIDVLSDLNVNNQFFGENIHEILETSHSKEKEMFFNLLKPEFLASLSPKYEENPVRLDPAIPIPVVNKMVFKFGRPEFKQFNI